MSKLPFIGRKEILKGNLGPQEPKPKDQQIGIGISSDKEKGTIRMQFGAAVSWLELDSVAAANVARLLLEQLKELNTN
jgi:hypothetical protein